MPGVRGHLREGRLSLAVSEELGLPLRVRPTRTTDTTYFGCLNKVFGPELDLAAFCDATDRAGRATDPYGSLRVTRSPRPECTVTDRAGVRCSLDARLLLQPHVLPSPRRIRKRASV